MVFIEDIHARQILDSRGNPTLEVDVKLSDGSVGRAAVPSGASTGKYEAYELRDKKSNFYNGYGVSKAVENVNVEIFNTFSGRDPLDQKSIDYDLIELDNTKNKSRLGANAMLGFSMAVARASANSKGLSLWQYIGGIRANTLPVPMMNIINGGAHANNGLDFQECMIMPIGFSTFSDALRAGVEIFQSLKNILSEDSLSTAVGDEGGFAPNLSSNAEALSIISDAVKKAGYSTGEDVMMALDCAASEFYQAGKYCLKGEQKTLSSKEFTHYLEDLCNKFPISSIEDGLDEADLEGWKDQTSVLGPKIQLVGDDLFVTDTELLKAGIKDGIANAILIKFNQVGTLTETLDAISAAKDAGYKVIISHRSGETEDTTIADLAVGTSAGQIKTGSLCRSDRVAKYNRLLVIESELATNAF